ncbi:cellulose synthase operon protein YhjQ [Stenotrophomonas sp. LMG 10879]|jgi:cellulose synthase operon protein YhjQ|uniref:cellulose biosynthesis protein BcsQ n=1 Tax=unclassified Stenotrophomonas TaxID=196198 RepID=UPI000C181230|nr:cellulose biosynthesis protein BcsQ [Stenotrophomonas sp. LMG 10879]MBN5051095.1 cellulose synthase operon protein YhjQ [Stenotrophomonas maltophilia]PII19525.1 cellulose synthase operon protein YhjQ [Stenotrophomonas sp. LMG 10879]HED4876817.1 cellulose synthase operon protein YhjQ [Stenotrophomonas maltophilia]
MSTVLSLQGVHGGTGVTTVLAALGQALHVQGQRVLLVECSPDQMLGLHLGLPAKEAGGWARAQLDGGDWRASAFACAPGLAVLPYGRVDLGEALRVEQWLQAAPATWAERMPLLSSQFDWLLFDLPQRLPAHVAAINQHAACTLPLRLACVDPTSHVVLQRQNADARRVLANRYDPAVPVQRDLMQLWLHSHAARLLPQPLHEDARVPAALASKQPLGRHAADSLAAADIDGLALWCLAEAARRQAEGAHG